MSIVSGVDRTEALVNKLKPRSRRVMKRCFMTGKQCIFSSQVAETAARPLQAHDLSVFVVMPFGPIQETFYRWSLKPFLIEGYRLSDHSIRRADEVRDIGYVVCEKICHRIQDADLVLADITQPNDNVFYELGLAYGLERPTILICNGVVPHPAYLNDPRLTQSLDIHEYRPLEYPGVGMLDPDRHEFQLHEFVKIPPKPLTANQELRISMLTVGQDVDGQQPNPPALDRLGLEEVMNGAIGVAMSEIRKTTESQSEPWHDVVRNIDTDDWTRFTTPQKISVDGRSNFEETARKLESSFCTVIDVSGNDPVAYFWLGYCHARGLNGIPVFRVSTPNGHIRGHVGGPAERVEPPLAFDIRTLWYAEYEDNKPYEFKDKMREILEHLLERDLPNRQKRFFWDRFPAERKLRVLTGTIHHPVLNRETVGDWDVRVVSELMSYLPSVREAMAIELATPLYSPEEAFRRWRRNHTNGAANPEQRREFISVFCKGIEGQLENCNAIIVASPDVNPVTEFMLHKICGVTTPDQPFGSCDQSDFTGYVVTKRLPTRPAKTSDHKDGNDDMPVEDSVEPFPRIFYRELAVAGEEQQNRGFTEHVKTVLTQGNELMRKYLSQDECTEEFELMGQLVVVRYPVNGLANSNLVVLLNGVSGPATFALAQILTGGGARGSSEMNSQSEAMLREINRALDEPNTIGVQAIIEVHIKPVPAALNAAGQSNTDGTVKNSTFLDTRKVDSWRFACGPTSIKRPHAN